MKWFRAPSAKLPLANLHLQAGLHFRSTGQLIFLRRGVSKPFDPFTPVSTLTTSDNGCSSRPDSQSCQWLENPVFTCSQDAATLLLQPTFAFTSTLWREPSSVYTLPSLPVTQKYGSSHSGFALDGASSGFGSGSYHYGVASTVRSSRVALSTTIRT